MKVKNQAPFPVIVVTFFDGRFGEECLVMPDEAEEVRGPLFLRVPGGEDVYFSVSGSFVVTGSGRHDPVEGVLLVAPGQPASVLYVKDGKRYGLRARHFRD